MPTNPTKAIIRNIATKEEVECQFNPNEYTLSKTNQWTNKPKKGANVGKTDFGGGQPAELKLQLFFDTTNHRNNVDQQNNLKHEDVRQYTNIIWDMMMVNSSTQNPKSKKGEPPQVQFQWGKGSFFTAVIKTITQKFTMFLDDGTPVRATLDVTFQQYKDEKIFDPQNPTSRSEARKIWVVVEGQTLDWIAYQEYGDPAMWRHIAETNDLDNPKSLRSGQILNLTPLP
ncbi:MAG: peptidoglycan-binding protein [Chloroflexota bacterium]|nr:MAG: peptidoglycan-binding protein [Chloroflexota bacterium]